MTYSQVQNVINSILSRNLFFIVGVPKSGTTWLQYILDAHPQIYCSGEGDIGKVADLLGEAVNIYNNHIVKTNKHTGTENFLMFSNAALQFLVISSVGLLFSKCTDYGCIGSKNPILLHRMEQFYALLPDLKFIHIIRDGRDNVTSAWFNNLRVSKAKTLKQWGDFHSFVKHGVQEWTTGVRKGRDFGAKHPDQYHEIHYEDLHCHPDANIRGLLNFLGVDASDPVVANCRDAGDFERHSNGRKREQEDKASFFRKGAVGDWKNHFDQECLDSFMARGGEFLREMGYSQ